MAGKHDGAWANASGANVIAGFEWNPRTTKAYAEGRAGVIANGHVVGSDAYRAYLAGVELAGFNTQKFETAIP